MILNSADKSLSRAVVLANGPVADYPALSQLILPDDDIVCVDGGLRHADALERTPRVVIGDMDSIEQARLREIADRVEVLRYPAEKDETDLEIALHWVASAGFDRALIAGISGGRLDHTLANIHLLARHEWRFELCFWEQGQYAWLINGGQSVQLDTHSGFTLSLLPLSETVTGISTRGMQYPLSNARLAFGSTRGISNVVLQSPAAVSVQSGKLLVIVTPPGPDRLD
ncbi:MAG: thiamine diphosphokinase [Gammaproteobacteria bacterium]|nr:thiamine diphosphokinase [Gammaproteobacteria bacterium]